DRLNKVIELQNTITLRKNKECTGKEFDVLIEGESMKGSRSLTGRTIGNKIVHISGQDGISAGDIVRVRIVSATVASLIGEVVTP
ncbi:MAG: TRAM domain-containing protein, partial [Nitrospira sp.]|nr:TRAM domain-containing protein [Nitrospira sp.]